MKAPPLPPGGTIGVAAASSPFEERSEIDRRIRCVKMQVRRNFLMLEREHRFDQAGHAGGSIEMSDVCFDGAERATRAACSSRSR